MLPSLPGAPLPAAFCFPLALLPDRQDKFMDAAVFCKAAQFVHIDLHRSHWPCAACRSQASVCTARQAVSMAHQCMSICNSKSTRSFNNMFQTCISWHDNQQGRLLFKGLPASALPSGHCLDQGASLGSELQQLYPSHPLPCEPFPTWIPHSQTAVVMHACFLLAAGPKLQQCTGELESLTCSILLASFDGVAQP